jgi:hypothetical protein
VHLEHDGERALVLAAHRVALAQELHAVPHHRAALGDVGLARRFRERVGPEAAVLLDGAGEHVVQQDPEIVEAHGDVGRDGLGVHVGLELLLEAPHHLRGEIPDARLELLGVKELGGHRVHRVEGLDLGHSEAFLQLVDLAVSRAVPQIGLHAEPLLLGLAEEQ